MKNVIVHGHCVHAACELAFSGFYNGGRKRAYEKAYKTIATLLTHDPDVLHVTAFVADQDPILRLFEQGDTVIYME